MNNTNCKIDSWEWFGLSYASWLVVPRIALQSMPEEWQHRFFGMLNELEEKLEHPDKSNPPEVPNGKLKPITGTGTCIAELQSAINKIIDYLNERDNPKSNS